MDNRHESMQQRNEGRQERRDDFSKNREDRWDNISNNREDRQDWRNQNREDWQNHREDMWDYRFDRADEIWDNVGDHYDDIFDDHWWGHSGWGYGGHYPVNPWWWWRPVTWAVATSFVYASAPPQPVYIDYGTTVVQEGETVYVDNKPVPAEKYNEPVVNLAVNVEQPPPPAPPAAEGKPAEWMPLGVFALAQEEKGEPIMFFQISISKDGKVSGGYESVLTNDQRPIAGQIDKETQNVAWRIGDNIETVFATTLANLTQDVSTVAIHFGKDRVQNWLLVRMPEPPPADKPPKAPELDRKVPPANPIPVNVK
ncbi:MAG: mu-protocadherin-cell-suface protein [Luteolibacter sp.]